MNNKNSEIIIFLSNKKNNTNNSKLFAIINKLVYAEIGIRICDNPDKADISHIRLLMDVKLANSRINKAIFNSVGNFKFGLTGTLENGTFNEEFVEKDIFINEKELNENSENIEFTTDFWALFINKLSNSRVNKELIKKIA